MGKNSRIAWTHHTFNPWWGCVKVSPACEHCYAEIWDRMRGGGISHWGPTVPRLFFGDKHWAEPIAWNQAAEREGARRRVFCGSMCDVFEHRVDLIDHRIRLWGLIEQTKNLDWLLLTRRPENIEGMLPDEWSSWGYFQLHNDLLESGNPFPPNVWLGITADNNDRFLERWPILENVGRRWYVPKLFISAEPLLGSISMTDYLNEFTEHEEDNVIFEFICLALICAGN